MEAGELNLGLILSKEHSGNSKDWELIRQQIVQIARAVGHIHSKGFIHGDLKRKYIALSSVLIQVNSIQFILKLQIPIFYPNFYFVYRYETFFNKVLMCSVFHPSNLFYKSSPSLSILLWLSSSFFNNHGFAFSLYPYTPVIPILLFLFFIFFLLSFFLLISDSLLYFLQFFPTQL